MNDTNWVSLFIPKSIIFPSLSPISQLLFWLKLLICMYGVCSNWNLNRCIYLSSIDMLFKLLWCSYILEKLYKYFEVMGISLFINEFKFSIFSKIIILWMHSPHLEIKTFAWLLIYFICFFELIHLLNDNVLITNILII